MYHVKGQVWEWKDLLIHKLCRWGSRYEKHGTKSRKRKDGGEGKIKRKDSHKPIHMLEDIIFFFFASSSSSSFLFFPYLWFCLLLPLDESKRERGREGGRKREWGEERMMIPGRWALEEQHNTIQYNAKWGGGSLSVITLAHSQGKARQGRGEERSLSFIFSSSACLPECTYQMITVEELTDVKRTCAERGKRIPCASHGFSPLCFLEALL